jgi:hypothetical protein
MDLNAPKKAYLELLDHPAIIMFNVFSDEIINIYSMPTLMSETTTKSLKGIANQALKLKINKTRGPRKNKNAEAFSGTGFSLIISLSASAIGCKIPKKPVQFGPRRFCIAPKTLRSNNVKKATTKIMFKRKYKETKKNHIIKVGIFS